MCLESLRLFNELQEVFKKSKTQINGLVTELPAWKTVKNGNKLTGGTVDFVII